MSFLIKINGIIADVIVNKTIFLGVFNIFNLRQILFFGERKRFKIYCVIFQLWCNLPPVT